MLIYCLDKNSDEKECILSDIKEKGNYSSISYAKNYMFISESMYEHAIDFENKKLKDKHKKKVFTTQELEFSKNYLDDDLRVLWNIKEALIKLYDMKLYDIISRKINLDLELLDEELINFRFKNEKYQAKIGKWHDISFAIIFKDGKANEEIDWKILKKEKD